MLAPAGTSLYHNQSRGREGPKPPASEGRECGPSAPGTEGRGGRRTPSEGSHAAHALEWPIVLFMPKFYHFLVISGFDIEEKGSFLRRAVGRLWLMAEARRGGLCRR